MPDKSFPVTEATAPAPQAAEAEAVLAQKGPARPRSVAVIEDDDDCRTIVVHLLREKGYAAEGAADGDSGLRMVLDRPPDLVLLDFNMPGLNGYELTRELRRREETRRLPIVVLTGSPNRRQLPSLGMDVACVLEKPVSGARLLGAIEKLIGPGAAGAVPLPAVPGATTGGPMGPPGAGSALPAPAPPPPEDLQVELQEDRAETETELELSANDSSLVSQVNRILIQAVELGASDIHVEPQEKQIVVRARLNGALQNMTCLPASVGRRLSTRLKIMSKLVITERRLPQDGQICATIRGKPVEFRVSTLPSIHGEKLVMRVLGGGKIQSDVGKLGFSRRDEECVRRALQSQHGLILVTGPTGSGKTTTLHTMLASLNSPDVNIMTAEDPVEYKVPGITQVHVNSRIGMTFENVLRAFLRQDPDIMLVGEIRDKETAEIAVKASITGHLVFSTLHTNGAPATISRLVHMGVAPFLLAASIKLVAAQRLVKLLCPDCRRPSDVPEDQQRLLTPQELGALQRTFEAAGCPSCRDSGYRGRKPIFEVMPVRSQEMRRRILDAEDADTLAALAAREGMTTLRQAALAAVASGETSMAEALKIVVAD